MGAERTIGLLSLLIRKGDWQRGCMCSHTGERREGEGYMERREIQGLGMETEASRGKATETYLRMGLETGMEPRDRGKDGAEKHWMGQRKAGGGSWTETPG